MAIAFALCAACVGEKTLKKQITTLGSKSKCSFCGKSRNVINIEQAADIFERVFAQHFYRTSDQESDDSYLLSKYSDSYMWDREGEDVAEVLQEVGEMSFEVAESIREALHDRHYDYEEAKMGFESEFAKDSKYAPKSRTSHELHSEWRQFEHDLKTKYRFFSQTGSKTLSHLFEDVQRYKTHKGSPIVVKAGPGTEYASLYRARVFQDDDKLIAALKRPDREIGPPPHHISKPGRMNARGISVFYGASDRTVALSEVRPFAGSRVVTASFELLRPMLLLDLEALGSVKVEGSLFDPEYLVRLQRADFLSSLSFQMTVPVMPDQEVFDYLPTQVIADFLSAKENPELDGIIYPSVQGAKGQNNVVLFHKSSLVEPMTFPPHTEIFAYTEASSEEAEPEYSVFEQVPPVIEKAPAKAEPLDDDDPFWTESKPRSDDDREPTLRVIESSIEVHHIGKINYQKEDFKVSRLRSEKRRRKF